LVGVLAISRVRAAEETHLAIKKAHNLWGDICVALVALIFVEVGCSQAIAANAFLTTNDNARVRYSPRQTDPLAKQVSEMNQIVSELALVNRSAKRESQTMSQARIDALMLKNSLVNMASSLDRYRAFFSSLYR
jgi:hypothetical protein